MMAGLIKSNKEETSKETQNNNSEGIWSNKNFISRQLILNNLKQQRLILFHLETGRKTGFLQINQSNAFVKPNVGIPKGPAWQQWTLT